MMIMGNEKLHLYADKGRETIASMDNNTITNKIKVTIQYDLSTKKIQVLRVDNTLFTNKRKLSTKNNRVTKKIKLLMEDNTFTNKRKLSIENNRVTKKIKLLKGEDYVTEKQNDSLEENSFFTNKRKVSFENNHVTKKTKLLKEEDYVTEKQKVSQEDDYITEKRKVSMEEKSFVTNKRRKVSMEENYLMEKQSVSMPGYIPDELIEQILVRLDVKNLLRCKSVCKSWKSLISHGYFIKAHQDHFIDNNANGHTRSDLAILPHYLKRIGHEKYIVGSSNGLVCINSFDCNEFIVANPWTREERMVSKLLASPEIRPWGSGSCWGFGFDPVTNDYKIVYGVKEGEYRTSFQVLSLKSNVWKHVGYANSVSRFGRLGILCNGALHWLMDHEGRPEKSSIISFDLSKEVFKEIPQPDDARYNPSKEDIPSIDFMVGIKDECLCIWHHALDDPHNAWIMQKYGVKESWVTLGSNFQRNNECIPDPSIDDVPGNEWSTHDAWFLEKCRCVPTITIMQSLISPHSSGQ